MPNLSTQYVGLTLRNPIVVSSAGITETVQRMKRAQEAGAGAVVMKGLSEEELTRKSPTPRFKILRQRLGKLRSFTLYSYEQSSVFDPDQYAQEVSKAKEALEIPVIASISCTTDQVWIEYSQLMERAGADALEVNPSCPHGPQVLSDTNLVEELARVTEMVKGAVSIPVIPKMTGQLANPDSAARKVEAAGADGVVMFNRFTGLEIDLEQERPIMHGAYAGHGGPWTLQYTLRWISQASPQLQIPIAASGGIVSSADVAKVILAGAQVAEICSAIVMEGYGIIGRIVDGLGRFMEGKGYQDLSQFRGKVCNRILTTQQVEREQRVKAHIDSGLCNACRVCYRVCIYDAVEPGEKHYAINEKCVGCGLCEQLCPQEAITMVPCQGGAK